MKEEQSKFDRASLLMLYLADELPEAEKARVERMLVDDAELRQELQLLQQSSDAAHSVLAELDENEHPLHESVAQRRAARLMRQWAQERKMPAPIPLPTVARRPIPWLQVSMAAAALVLVGFVTWGVYHPSRRSPIRMASVPLNNDDRLRLMSATLGIGDLDDTDDAQTLTPQRLDDVDFSGDVSGRLGIQ